MQTKQESEMSDDDDKILTAAIACTRKWELY